MNQTQTESIRFALKALEGLINRTSAQAIYSFMETERRIAISACVGLREALAEQPTQQEPVAALQRVMARLAYLLDEDQFAEIEGIAVSAGVAPFECQKCSTKFEVEQPAQQEPVAAVIRNSAGQIALMKPDGNAFDVSKYIGHSFYTSPTASKPLTERELIKCITQAKCFDTVKMTYESGPYEIDRPTLKAFELARAIEAKLREKNA